MKPPRGARTLLRLALPRDVRDAAIGDLDEEFTTHVAPDRGRASAVAWYWRQAIASLPAALRLRWSTGSGRAHAHERDAAVMTDLRYGLRLLRRYPSFTLAVVSTHGLGVAVTCAVVSIVYAMLRPLPYADPERLVHLHETLEGREAGGGQSSYPDFLELRRSARSFEYVGGYSGGSRTVTARAVPAERVPMAEVTDGFFEALGVQPLMGRLFEPADGRRDGPPVVAITYASWRRRFNADPSIVGRLLTLNGQAHTIVAVLPAGFEFPLRGLAELWLPMRPSRAQEERQYYHWMDIIARVRRDVSAEQLRDDLAAIARRLTEVDPKYHPSPRLSATPLHDDVIGSLRSAMLVLTAAVALVMLVTCANVAGLMLARAAGREREMSVRAAVGASGVRLARQLLIESLLLGAPGSALGLLAGHWIARVFVASLPPFQRASLPRLQNLSIDPSVALISLTAALATALLFGLAPAWRAAHGRACVSFSGAGRSSASVREGRLRGALVAAQVALTFILLASAGLVGKSVYRLLRVSPGFDATNLLTLRVNLGAHYTKAEQILAFHDEFLHRLRAQPGVSGAESIDQLPLTGRGNTGTFSIDGRPDPQKDATHVTAIRGVSRGYFRVMGIPLLGGRGFASSDTASTTRVAS